jgi:hypothetical protein
MGKFLRVLNYWKSVLFHPEWGDFADMGTGIEARHARCRTYWRKHIELSRAFQERYAAGGGHIIVLGAGRLLDVPVQEICRRYEKLTLWDADHTAQRYWKGISKAGNRIEVEERLEDCTGVLTRWTTELSEMVRKTPPNLDKLIQFLSNSKVAVDEAPAFGPADTVISTNLLSQIPIYWRDRVHTILEKKWGITTDSQGEYDAELQGALNASMKTLQNEHLAALGRSGAPSIIMVYDEFFAFYRKDIAPWQIEPALYIHKVDIPGYESFAHDTWLWHIAPQGVEQDEYGSIHKVVAQAFRKV